MSLFQIGEVAERTGLSLRTVRYYEEVGLAAPSRRSDGGFRLYGEEDVQRLLAVKRMKSLGLSLEEMRDLLALLGRSAHPELLSASALLNTVAALAAYAERTDTQIARLERELAEVRELRLRIGERSGRLEAVTDYRSAPAV